VIHRSHRSAPLACKNEGKKLGARPIVALTDICQRAAATYDRLAQCAPPAAARARPKATFPAVEPTRHPNGGGLAMSWQCLSHMCSHDLTDVDESHTTPDSASSADFPTLAPSPSAGRPAAGDRGIDGTRDSSDS